MKLGMGIWYTPTAGSVEIDPIFRGSRGCQPQFLYQHPSRGNRKAPKSALNAAAQREKSQIFKQENRCLGPLGMDTNIPILTKPGKLV
jgi:hypothetical protein